MRNRRGLSEIISTMIVITVVVAGLGLYTGLSQQRILGDTLTVKEAIDQKDEQISELMEFVDMAKIPSKDVIGVFVHNYGLKNITISEVYVNGTIDMDTVSNPVYVRDLNENQIMPNNKVIPLGKTSEIILNFTGNTVITNGISNVVIKSDSNRILQIVNETQ